MPTSSLKEVGVAKSSVKRIAVFTGTRAEFGLLTPILRELSSDESVELTLIVAGSHLSSLHGMTVTDIEREGFRVDARVEMLLASDSSSAATKSLGIALIDLASIFERFRPELLLVLGDRYEVLAAATAATLAGIPIAHLHGGEITEGAFDDSIRHAVTKLSHLHFVATSEFGRRVRQLGEEDSRIFVVGAPTVDAISSLAPLTRTQLEAEVGFSLSKEFALVIYHPSTIPGESASDAVGAIFRAVDRHDDVMPLCFLPNADPTYGDVRAAIESFVESRPNARLIASLPHGLFLSLLRQASVIVGNSSAGIVEAPLLGTATVNVGQRQEGRPRAPSVLDVPPDEQEIYGALARVRRPDFQSLVEKRASPYSTGISASAAVATVLRSMDLSTLLAKRFSDIGSDRPESLGDS